MNGNFKKMIYFYSSLCRTENFGLSPCPEICKAKSHFLVPHPVQSPKGGGLYRIPHMCKKFKKFQRLTHVSEYLVSVQSDQTFHYIRKSVSGRGTWLSYSLEQMTPPLHHHNLQRPGNNGFQF